MNDKTLKEQDRREVVIYRLEKSARTYDAALRNIELGLVETAANRLYYSAYYAVSALLIAYGIVVRTHAGVKRMLGLGFVKPKLLDRNYGVIFNRLLSLRMTGDYEDRKNLDLETDIKPLVRPTQDLIDTVAKMARDKMQL